MTWNYRMTVRGRFADLDEDQRRSLRAEQKDHDMFAARFSPEGSFLYAPELATYQHRFLITVDESAPEDAETLARIEAEQLAVGDLDPRGLSGRTVDVSAVCVDDIKVRPTIRR